jgi:seryl-tRNA synthetase
MLQIAYIRENKDEVIKRLAKKNIEASSLVNLVVELDEKRRSFQSELETIKSESNKLSKDIGELMKSGEKGKAEILKEKSVQLRERSSTKEKGLNCNGL